MKNRVNSRNQNLAKISPEKAEADSMCTQGLLSLFSYFDKNIRKIYKIDISNISRWIYHLTNDAVQDNQYMYAVGPNGALYLGNVTVHSQFKAGKETQSAGWLCYSWDDNSQKAVITLDNCSGHYTPTLSQFLSTLHGLYEAKFLPDQFEICLNKFTQCDYEKINQDFWTGAIESIEKDKTPSIHVRYIPKNKDFIFSMNNQELSMSVEEIKEKDYMGPSIVK